MKKTILLLVVLCAYNNTFSQQNIDINIETFLLSSNNVRNSKIIANGSPYIDETFSPVKIDAFKDVIFSGRYNAYNGQMEIIPAPGKDPIAINLNVSSYIVKFLKTNKEYEPHDILDKDGIINKGFLVNVLKDKVSLLKKESIKFYERQPATSGYDQEKPAKFVRQSDIYLYKIEGNNALALELPKRDKDIAKLFPKHSKNILDYIKSEKIKTGKEEDLIKLFEYINTL